MSQEFIAVNYATNQELFKPTVPNIRGTEIDGCGKRGQQDYINIDHFKTLRLHT